MSTTCQLCGTAIASGAPAVSVRLGLGAASPFIAETVLGAARDGALAYLCPSHEDAIRLLRRISADRAEAERRIRGELFQELDLLAFALEMEAAAAVEQGQDEDAARAQQTRLGIRLAQRRVGGVSAPEVDRRLDRWREEYRARFPGG